MTVQAVRILNQSTGSKIAIPEGKETVDVCKAIAEIKAEGLQQGQRGIVINMHSTGLTPEQIAEMTLLSLSDVLDLLGENKQTGHIPDSAKK